LDWCGEKKKKKDEEEEKDRMETEEGFFDGVDKDAIVEENKYFEKTVMSFLEYEPYTITFMRKKHEVFKKRAKPKDYERLGIAERFAKCEGNSTLMFNTPCLTVKHRCLCCVSM
jgi:hypothetical protein